MTQIRFEWDLAKAAANERKHGISFEEARTAFSDEQGLLLDDPDHRLEARFILLGLGSSLRLLVVVHAVPLEDVIRIISARKATRREARIYATRSG
ncbi:MAG: BrnT family toxin [Gemmatimonadota bacterium]